MYCKWIFCKFKKSILPFNKILLAIFGDIHVKITNIYETLCNNKNGVVRLHNRP